MSRGFILLPALLVLPVAPAQEAAVIRTVRDLLAAVYDQPEPERTFDLQALVTYPLQPLSGDGFVAVSDGTGFIVLNDMHSSADKPIRPGDILHVRGKTDTDTRDRVYASCATYELVGHETPPAPQPVTTERFLSGACDFRSVELTGIVRDVFVDEIDPGTMLFALSDGSRTVYAALSRKGNAQTGSDRYDGAHVILRGLCTKADHGFRQQFGRYLYIKSESAITILQPAPSPFASPLLGDLRQAQPSEVVSMGKRRAQGRVLATWNGRNLLLKLDNGTLLGAQTDQAILPRHGERIEIVGIPETDLYRINLSRAVWRRMDPQPTEAAQQPERTRAEQLLIHKAESRRFNYAYHGRLIQLSGIVRMPPNGSQPQTIVECEGIAIPVDTESCGYDVRDIPIGTHLSATGICVMETDCWCSNSGFPRIRNVILVPRSPSDIIVHSRPSWWTAGRLTAVIATLLVILAVILIWNAALRHFATRKGRELFKAQVAKVSSELRVDERTRLAVELHDSISQNLTGVSMQIDSADRFLDSNGEEAHRHLAIASRTLDSCREELRNCIWDLRSQALEEHTVDAAIRTALVQRIGNAKLAVRFDVPRTSLSDKTVHAILSVVRELATNAVRHGHATVIRIAGTVEENRLLFSVSDNGCGFDPNNRQGIAEGHFGLQGISERIKDFRGDMRIESSPGKGTRIAIALTLTAHEPT